MELPPPAYAEAPPWNVLFKNEDLTVVDQQMLTWHIPSWSELQKQPSDRENPAKAYSPEISCGGYTW